VAWPAIVPRQINVDIAAVRESGLIKEKVLVLHPKSAIEADWTLLRESAETWAHMSKEWADYCLREKVTPIVRPILVVQVEDVRVRDQRRRT